MENGLYVMADIPKLVNDLSNLTITESAQLAKMLKEQWGAVERPS